MLAVPSARSARRKADLRMTIPLVDLAAQFTEVADEVEGGRGRGPLPPRPLWAALRSRPSRRRTPRFCGVEHCVGVANGTDALRAGAAGAHRSDPAMRWCVPANTFIATAEAVLRLGAVRSFVDAEPDTTYSWTAGHGRRSPHRAGHRRSCQSHLFGQAAAGRGGAWAWPRTSGRSPSSRTQRQSQGATRYGRATGSLGDVAATSFYPGKNLGAAGDAGAVTTDDSEIAAGRAAVGQLMAANTSTRHERLGFNSRLDTLQAVVADRQTARGCSAVERAAPGVGRAVRTSFSVVFPRSPPR